MRIQLPLCCLARLRWDLWLRQEISLDPISSYCSDSVYIGRYVIYIIYIVYQISHCSHSVLTLNFVLGGIVILHLYCYGIELIPKPDSWCKIEGQN